MRAYSLDLRERVMMDVDAGMKIREISDKYRVTTKWIGDLRKLRAETGSLEPRRGNRWAQGDFDNNGVVDFDDYAYIDGSFFGQGAPLLSANISAVPEPSTWVLGGLAMLGLTGLQLRRRRLA